MTAEPVAVVAAECVLPGAADLAQFHRNIGDSVSSIREADDAFWRGAEVFDRAAGGRANTSYSNIGGFLDTWEFDRTPFRIAPKVLDRMDPVHLLGMELARRVVDRCERDASLPRAATAVLVANVDGGVTSRISAVAHTLSHQWEQAVRHRRGELADVLAEYGERYRELFPDKREDLGLNGESETLGGRIANYFDLRGTHYGIDAACASSLAAVHAACQGLEQREFDAALVLAVGMLSPDLFVGNSESRTLSRTGSFPFGARADGLVPGEGGVLVALVRLADARRDGRRVLGVIRGIGYSSNGRTTSTWSVSAEAEARAIRKAFEGVAFGPGDVDYVEAHGTSTAVGDGVEIAAMLDTYGSVPRSYPLPYGSAKSMVGHTVESAGLVGMLRAMFLFQQGKLPPTVGVGEPRPEAVAAGDRLRLQRDVAAVRRVEGRPLRVGVSAFGYGGINYHLLFEQDDGAPAPATTRPRREPVAVVAMEAVAPDAHDLESFWRNLEAGVARSRDLREVVPGFDLFWSDPALRRATTYLDRVATAEVPRRLDNRRFRILPNQVPGLTDELLLLIACAGNLATALDTALAKVDRERAGCVIGHLLDSDRQFELQASIRFVPWLRGLRKLARQRGVDAPWRELRDELWHDPALRLRVVDQDTTVSGFGSTLASSLATAFDLRGKSYGVRAACATGLTALSLAAQELRAGTLDFVLCGAVCGGVGLVNHTMLAAIRALSAQAVGRPYDADGDGFIIGAGAGLVALKRLADAERDGDQVLAVLREVSGSSDGKGRSLLAPSAEGRALAMRRTYELSGIDPSTVSYVEGHGAATALGDRSEVEALAGTLGNRETVYLGSVKGNVGHQKAAAGMTAVIKTILCLRHRTLVPTPGFRTPHRALRLDQRRFEVLSESRPWPAAGDAPRRAAVNAFGLAGINYHAILEEYLPPAVASLWSADDPGGLADDLAAFAEGGPPPSEVDESLPHRMAVAGDAAAARRAARLHLAATAAGRPPRWEAAGVHVAGGPPGGVCFLYPGQGSQYHGMLRSAGALVPGVAEVVAEAAAALADDVPDLVDAFWRSDEERGTRWLAATEHCQVATLLVSKVLEDWLAARGVRPDLRLGHSFGELSALHAAGSLSFADALRTAHHRGRFAAGVRGRGRGQAMAVLFTSAARVAELIGTDHPDVVVANRNGPGQTVVAGYADAVGRVLGRAALDGVDGRPLPIERAFHSPLARDAVPDYRHHLGGVPVRGPRGPVYETLTSRPYPDAADADRVRDSLARQFVAPVDFQAMVEDAYGRGARTFVEVGPKRALTGLVAELLADRPDVRTVSLVHPKGGEAAHLRRAWAQLWVLGLADRPAGRPRRPAPPAAVGAG
ncbi:beta-ketoacyl synthase N-terminal-like domain-containing protein [Actinosynnema sp. NPDC023587]|uniref:beta-ketoacyl synthase N-terminal-like domain-containing protein n=1 Tax=Actinosynnema sp. NPDC023587 TaxID=3154695 RepID=UPI0033F161DA